MENTINFSNVKTAFGYKKNKELRFTYFIFRILQHPVLVKMLTRVANYVVKYNLPFQGLVKSTVFKIFCSGENLNEAIDTVQKLNQYKVKSVLDYVSEGDQSEKAFNENTNIILANIKKLNSNAPGNSISVKLSGLENVEFLKNISAPGYKMDPASENRYQRFYNRVDVICATAHQHSVIVYVDAEERDTQDIFDKLVEEMMEKYNRETAIVYNTLQMYLTDRLDYLSGVIARSEVKKYHPGIKLVRGAYVEKERERAKTRGLKSPVYDTKKQTDDAFNKAIDVCLSNSRVYTCIATHNEESTQFAIDCIRKYNIVNPYEKVKFSQLLGMSDNLTFNLASFGYNASKYLPYGEVKKAIPYLVRRAEENSSISGQMPREVTLLEKELKRRKDDKGRLPNLLTTQQN
jgi:proline dehydrogenase